MISVARNGRDRALLLGRRSEKVLIDVAIEPYEVGGLGSEPNFILYVLCTYQSNVSVIPAGACASAAHFFVLPYFVLPHEVQVCISRMYY